MDYNEFLTFKNQTEVKLNAMKRRNNQLLFVTISLVVVLFITAFSNASKFDSIRTKELIVEDNEGNDRVIISSEISATKTRIRKDTLSGMLVLDKSGNDRVIVGASPTFKLNHKEIIKRAVGGPYGIAFNDELGIERGGLGYYADKGLSALGLDGPSGEGIVLFVPQKEMFGQKAGIIINDPQNGGQLFYIGANTNGERIINMDVQGKGRFSIEMDSTSSTKIKYFDNIRQLEKILLDSNK